MPSHYLSFCRPHLSYYCVLCNLLATHSPLLSRVNTVTMSTLSQRPETTHKITFCGVWQVSVILHPSPVIRPSVYSVITPAPPCHVPLPLVSTCFSTYCRLLTTQPNTMPLRHNIFFTPTCRNQCIFPPSSPQGEPHGSLSEAREGEGEGEGKVRGKEGVAGRGRWDFAGGKGISWGIDSALPFPISQCWCHQEGGGEQGNDIHDASLHCLFFQTENTDLLPELSPQ